MLRSSKFSDGDKILRLSHSTLTYDDALLHALVCFIDLMHEVSRAHEGSRNGSSIARTMFATVSKIIPANMVLSQNEETPIHAPY